MTQQEFDQGNGRLEADPAWDPSRAGEDNVALSIIDAKKRFGDNQAVGGVGLTIERGEVLGLLGANGAGKSTLLRIITGVTTPDAGTLKVYGEPVDLDAYNPAMAAELGIFCVYQELSLCENLTVAENFALLERERTRGWRRRSASRARAALASIFPGAEIDVNREVGELTIGDRQVVEIARVASIPTLRILILDEPTSALTAERAHQLHEFLARSTSAGLAVIFVTHKLDEVQIVANRATILRNGQVEWVGNPAESTSSELIARLGGASTEADDADEKHLVEIVTSEVPSQQSDTAVNITDLTWRDLKNINLHVLPGEIVGIAGLEGAGQRNLLRAVFTARRHAAITVNGQASYVSGDRQNEGLFPLWTIGQNITAASLKQNSRVGVLEYKSLNQLASTWFDHLQIRAGGVDSDIMGLSGGNQQKALIARGIASDATTLILDDPTRGVDIETKQVVYQMLREVRDKGRAVILYSTEDREFSLCDRVYVMQRGRISAELRGDEITVEAIVKHSYPDATEQSA